MGNQGWMGVAVGMMVLEYELCSQDNDLVRVNRMKRKLNMSPLSLIIIISMSRSMSTTMS
jgi:hypothetical protein